MEECIGIDDTILREVIIPVMAISRRAKDGTTNEKEPLNKSQIYINFFGQRVINIYTILKHKSYQDYWYDYQKIAQEQKE